MYCMALFLNVSHVCRIKEGLANVLACLFMSV